jgi:hypothetical protein
MNIWAESWELRVESAAALGRQRADIRLEIADATFCTIIFHNSEFHPNALQKALIQKCMGDVPVFSRWCCPEYWLNEKGAVALANISQFGP